MGGLLAQEFGSCWGGVHQFCYPWTTSFGAWKASRGLSLCGNTYLVGRLRALPPDNDTYPTVPGMESPGSVAMQGPDGVTSLQEAAVAPLPDRIDALNSSLDPWERTGATRLGDSPPPDDGTDSGLYPIETANRRDPPCIRL